MGSSKVPCEASVMQIGRDAKSQDFHKRLCISLYRWCGNIEIQTSKQLSRYHPAKLNTFCQSCIQRGIWLSRILGDLRAQNFLALTTISVDTNGSMDMSRNVTVNDILTKQIDICNGIRFEELFVANKVILKRCNTADQVGDPLTKDLEKVKHQRPHSTARPQASTF